MYVVQRCFKCLYLWNVNDKSFSFINMCMCMCMCLCFSLFIFRKRIFFMASVSSFYTLHNGSFLSSIMMMSFHHFPSEFRGCKTCFCSLFWSSIFHWIFLCIFHFIEPVLQLKEWLIHSKRRCSWFILKFFIINI